MDNRATPVGPDALAPMADRTTGTGAVVGHRVRTARYQRLILAAIPIGLSLLFAVTIMDVWRTDAYLEPFTDVTTYLAAGERLNAGHDLYALRPGDRPVLILSTFDAPLLSPPPIAALWRPLANDVGFGLWVIACWTSLLGTLAYLVLRIGLPAAVAGSALALPIGEMLAASNVAAFFPMLLVLAWWWRDHPRSAVLLGAMAAIKLTPAVMGGWAWRRLGWFFAGAVGFGVIGLLGAGPGAYFAYLDVARTTSPSDLSLSGLSGLPWLTPAVLVAGTVTAALLPQRRGFVVGVVAMVLGTPALYASTLAVLLGTLAPLLRSDDREGVGVAAAGLVPAVDGGAVADAHGHGLRGLSRMAPPRDVDLRR